MVIDVKHQRDLTFGGTFLQCLMYEVKTTLSEEFDFHLDITQGCSYSQCDWFNFGSGHDGCVAYAPFEKRDFCSPPRK